MDTLLKLPSKYNDELPCLDCRKSFKLTKKGWNRHRAIHETMKHINYEEWYKDGKT